MAKTVSYYVALVILLLHFRKKDRMIRVKKALPKPAHIRDIFVYGSPNALQQICRSFLVIVMNWLIIALAGSDDIVVYAAITSAGNLCMTIGTGIGQSTSIITGVFAGEKDLTSVKIFMKNSMIYTIAGGALILAVMVTIAGLFMPIFLEGEEMALLAEAVFGFRIFCLGMIFY